MGKCQPDAARPRAPARPIVRSRARGAPPPQPVADGRARWLATYSPRRRSSRRDRRWARASVGGDGDRVVGGPRASTRKRRAGDYVRPRIRSQHNGGRCPAQLRSSRRRCRCRRQSHTAGRLPAPRRCACAGRGPRSGGNHSGSRSFIDESRSKLVDGEQIAVGLAPTQAAGSTGSSTDVTGAGELVDLNTATAEQLDALPGVGPVLAQHILDWRSTHGRFDSADQLREVSGIGPTT